MKRLVVWGIIGCLIFVFGFLAGSFWTTMKFFRDFPTERAGVVGSSGSPVGPFDPSSSFYGNIFWGGSFKAMDEMAPLPQGDATINVHFSHDGKPAAGVGFFLALNGKYHTGMLTTDTNGEAEISLPFGRWVLNRLECRKWAAKPEGEFLLVSGDETKLGTAPMDALYFHFGLEGRVISLNEDDHSNQTVAIEIKRRIESLWPYPDERKQKASIAESKIQWEPYPKAVSYVVQINNVTRESARSTTFRPIVHKRVDNASVMALSELPHVESDGSSNEYAIGIRAYAQDGTFLSETEHGFSTFSLTDNHILVKYDQSDEITFNQDDVERAFQAQKTLDAAALLIKKEMFDEAHLLLEQPDASVSPERLAMMNGYLYAAQGRCEEADKYFEEALSRGQKCIPEKYRKGCRADQKE